MAAQRDLLSTVLEANLAVISVEQTKVSVRQNAAIEQLTILATIFLPLTFVTGFFGQNFEWLVGHINSLAAFLIYGLGGLALPMVSLFWWLTASRKRTPKACQFSPGRVRDGQATSPRCPTGTALPRRQLRPHGKSASNPGGVPGAALRSAAAAMRISPRSRAKSNN